MLRHKQGVKSNFRVYFQHHVHWQHFRHLLVVRVCSYVTNSACDVTNKYELLDPGSSLETSNIVSGNERSYVCVCV